MNPSCFQRAFVPLCFAVLMASCGPDVAAPGTVLNQSTLPIINGDLCDEEQLETAVAIIISARVSMFGSTQEMVSPICTGTLVAPDVVLAAAHCFNEDLITMGMGTVENASYYITFESDLTDLSEGKSTSVPDSANEIYAFVVHPDFNMDNFGNVSGPGDYKDISIAFLTNIVPDIRPELIITADEASQIEKDHEVEIAGWGQQTETQNQWQPPPAGTVGQKVCATSFINDVGDYEFQVGSDRNSSRKCHGDSGGPTYMTVETGGELNRRIIGITSHSYDESDCAKGGVDTRVDVWLDWIDSEMKKACEDGTRMWCDEPGIIQPDYYNKPPADTTTQPAAGPNPTGCQCSSSSGLPGSSIVFPLIALLLLVQARKWRPSHVAVTSSNKPGLGLK